MKTFYKLFVVLMLLAMLVPACAPKPVAEAPKDFLTMPWDQIVEEAKKEGELSYFAWWGEEYWKTAADKFEAQYGIKVNIVMGDNPIEKALAEKDLAVGTMDVSDFGGAAVKTAIDAGIVYGPILPILPDADKLDPTLSKVQEGVQTGGYLVPIYRNQVGLLYNPEKVPNPPQTWEELQAFIDANPKQFAFCDPNKGGTGQAMVQTVVANLTGGLDQYMLDKELDPAKTAKYTVVWDWFKANMDKVTLTASNNESTDTLNQGATSLVLAWDDDTQIAFNKGTLF